MPPPCPLSDCVFDRLTRYAASASDGIDFNFGRRAFLSDESGQYDIFILEDNYWIVQELDGSIRVWYQDLEETFYRRQEDIICEKIRKGNQYDYVQVAV